MGGEAFFRSLSECESPATLYRAIMETPQDKTIADQWQSQILARILMKHRVIFVTRPALAETIRQMKMDYAASLDEAMQKARETAGSNASVTVIPNGVSICVRPLANV